MASVVICGGSVLGLATGMLLARDGHEVTLLEADPDAVPTTADAAWHGWRRKGVPHFHQPHNLFPRVRQIIERELPGVSHELLDAGCVWADLFAVLPPTLPTVRRRPEDDRFHYVTGRRPAIELAFARAAVRQRGLRIRRGVPVTGLLTTDGTVPRVTGVQTTGGEEIAADLVVDAMGRRSPAGDWISGLGGGQPLVDSADAGFAYYTRYFAGDHLPRAVGPALSELGSFSLLTLPGDNGTWSVTVFGSNRDTVLKHVREPEYFSRLVRACPAHAHWLQGEPVTDVLPMAGILDRYRSYVLDGRPMVAGFVAVGDAWACTNPAAGRGLSVGMLSATVLRDTLRTTLTAAGSGAGATAAEDVALAYAAALETAVAPYYWNQKAADAARFAEMTALREGRDPIPPADPHTGPHGPTDHSDDANRDPNRGPDPDPHSGADSAADLRALATAMAYDEEVFRGYLDTVGCLALPQEVLARPGVAERVRTHAQRPMPTLPAPRRDQVVRLLS